MIAHVAIEAALVLGTLAAARWILLPSLAEMYWDWVLRYWDHRPASGPSRFRHDR